jgi:D-glycero-D-manno-heptose 1,7-bisphosphate phosphatase
LPYSYPTVAVTITTELDQATRYFEANVNSNLKCKRGTIILGKRAVFLDRDGVLNIEAGYLSQIADLHLIPGVAQAVRQLNDLGLFCCLVSNQSGPARGYYSPKHIEALHDRLSTLLLLEANAHLDARYFCPYLSPASGGSDPSYAQWSTWRKPNTGMLITAAWEHDLDIRQSFMVGDKATDIDLAHNVGCQGILVQTGFGLEVLDGSYQHPTEPNYLAQDLTDAVQWIVSQVS